MFLSCYCVLSCLYWIWFKLAVLGVFCMLYWIGVYFCFFRQSWGLYVSFIYQSLLIFSIFPFLTVWTWQDFKFFIGWFFFVLLLEGIKFWSYFAMMQANTVCLPEPKTLICCYKVYCACKTCTMNIILYTPTSVLCSRKFYWKFVHFLRIYVLVFYLINNWKDIIFSTHRFCD